MNKENIKRLHDYIEKSSSFSYHAERWGGGEYDQEYLDGRAGFYRGTPACIFGHWQEMTSSNSEQFGEFKKFLNLPDNQIIRLIFPDTKFSHYDSRPGKKRYVSKGESFSSSEETHGN